jgi:2-oxo-4-hydroxy-4-carboxy-5-ureidoimidazoline decarboxylase
MAQGLNTLSEEQVREALGQCCGASRWVEGMMATWPFEDRAALNASAHSVWSQMDRKDILEAFDHHPRIGSDLGALRKKFSKTASLSEAEQASVASAEESTLIALRDGNQNYEARYGHIFIVCATGKSAAEMLTILASRMHNNMDIELKIAAGEQAKITQLRLENIVL